MRGPGRSRADRALRARRLREVAILLPVAGLVLTMPPVANVFALPVRLGGVPLVVAYIFVVWAALILAARAIGRRLARNGGGG
ncbi:MAG TPA: hypothetical protein VMM55_10785 [Thermohalobaculum sp.]|nr:hypothetical protein [Thermohalobaculum sp.]